MPWPAEPSWHVIGILDHLNHIVAYALLPLLAVLVKHPSNVRRFASDATRKSGGVAVYSKAYQFAQFLTPVFVFVHEINISAHY